MMATAEHGLHNHLYFVPNSPGSKIPIPVNRGSSSIISQSNACVKSPSQSSPIHVISHQNSRNHQHHNSSSSSNRKHYNHRVSAPYPSNNSSSNNAALTFTRSTSSGTSYHVHKDNSSRNNNNCRQPKFEAYMMTGDIIINLASTKSSENLLPSRLSVLNDISPKNKTASENKFSVVNSLTNACSSLKNDDENGASDITKSMSKSSCVVSKSINEPIEVSDSRDHEALNLDSNSNRQEEVGILQSKPHQSHHRRFKNHPHNIGGPNCWSYSDRVNNDGDTDIAQSVKTDPEAMIANISRSSSSGSDEGSEHSNHSEGNFDEKVRKNGNKNRKVASISAESNVNEKIDQPQVLPSLPSAAISNTTSSMSSRRYPSFISPDPASAVDEINRRESNEYRRERDSNQEDNIFPKKQDIYGYFQRQPDEQNQNNNGNWREHHHQLRLQDHETDKQVAFNDRSYIDQDNIRDNDYGDNKRGIDNAQNQCEIQDLSSENESGSEDEIDILNTYSHLHSSPKNVDRDAASRLAKRLYNLEGFKRSDVCRHLSKNNDFSRVVTEEYLKCFDFKGDTLDGALRKFLGQFCLIGETQERERVLQHFSKRYAEGNPGEFKSVDAVHTLTCAIMLLNTDLHGEAVGRKMTSNEFIENLSGLNDGENFPREVLNPIYLSIKSQPIQWALDEEDFGILGGDKNRLGFGFTTLSGASIISGSSSGSLSSTMSSQTMLGGNPFLKLPNPNNATVYKVGCIMRKCCFDMNGKKTPLGKRGWNMFYATLRDLVLFLHKDEQGYRKKQLFESLHNSIRIHHALATPATDYTKRQYVFRLKAADESEYLFQTRDAQELKAWIDTINLVAGTLSAPALPSAIGSQSKKFQKPLLPTSHTKYNSREQLADHEAHIQRLTQELEEHVSKHQEKSLFKRALAEHVEKQKYLEYELKRYTTYASILRSKLQQAYGSGALLDHPLKPSTLTTKSKPLTQLSIGEEQDMEEDSRLES